MASRPAIDNVPLVYEGDPEEDENRKTAQELVTIDGSRGNEGHRLERRHGTTADV
jgi:hypothetical protein